MGEGGPSDLGSVSLIFYKENGQYPDSGSKNSENQNNDAVS